MYIGSKSKVDNFRSGHRKAVVRDFTKFTGKHLCPGVSALTVSPCVTRFHYLSHGLTVGSSFLTVLQNLSGFSHNRNFLRKQTENTIPCQKML